MNPNHEPNWQAIAATPGFQELLRAKRRFVIPCCIFFTCYYFALLYFVGWHPELMKKAVIGKVNIAYLFALSQFFMSWILAWLYIRKSSTFDRTAATFLMDQKL